jgi:hypothetical protein
MKIVRRCRIMIERRAIRPLLSAMAMALVASCYVPAAAIGPNDPASVYYEKCVTSARKAPVPDERCDGLILDGLTGIIIGQFNQVHPAFCFPQRLEDQMQVKSFNAIANLRDEMRAAVARYMRERPERLSEKTLLVIFEALLHAFPCPS